MNNEIKIKINVPEGMEIDRENSTLECIKLKPKWIPKKGDIAVARSQIILVSEYIKKNFVGFDVKSLAVFNTNDNTFTIWKHEDPSLWVLGEASASEKELFINKLKERGYIYDPNDPRIIYKKEKELPKTWEEFRKNNPVSPNEYFVSTGSCIARGRCFRSSEERIENVDDNLLPSKEYAEAMLALCKLIQLRDCYNDGWKPNWENPRETKYVITTYCNAFSFRYDDCKNVILAFKSDKLRDEFYNNFKDLIEQAKLLL